MSTKKEKFDESIKVKFTDFKEPEECFPGIYANNEKKDYGRYLKQYKNHFYCTYFSESFEKSFIPQINDLLPESYQGNEISSGKFFSVASSSRFTIASFSKKQNGKYIKVYDVSDTTNRAIDFEYPCEIKEMPEGLTAPQLDAHFIRDNEEWFIEAKCHEIFDYHKPLYLKSTYREVLLKLFPDLQLSKLSIEIDSTEEKDKEKKDKFLAVEDNGVRRLLQSDDFKINRKTTHFDFKQFICHLLGIISKRDSSKKTVFAYLFYHNTDKEFEKTYQQLQEEIEEIQTVFKPIFDANKIEFGYLYNDHFSTIKKLELKK